MIAKDRARTQQLLRLVPELSEICQEEMKIIPKDVPRTMTDSEWALVKEYVYRHLCVLNLALHAAVRYRPEESWMRIINEEAIDDIILSKRDFYRLSAGPVADVLAHMVPERDTNEFYDWIMLMFVQASKEEFIELSNKYKEVIIQNNWQSDIKQLWNEQY